MFIFRHQQTPKQSKVQTIRLYICILQYVIHLFIVLVEYTLSRLMIQIALFYSILPLLYSTLLYRVLYATIVYTNY